MEPLGQGKELNDPAVVAIAEAHGKTPAQVVLRWQMQIGCVAIPKTARPARILENIALSDFELRADEMAADRRPRPARRPDRPGPGDLLLSGRPPRRLWQRTITPHRKRFMLTASISGQTASAPIS